MNEWIPNIKKTKPAYDDSQTTNYEILYPAAPRDNREDCGQDPITADRDAQWCAMYAGKGGNRASENFRSETVFSLDKCFCVLYIRPGHDFCRHDTPHRSSSAGSARWSAGGGRRRRSLDGPQRKSAPASPGRRAAAGSLKYYPLFTSLPSHQRRLQ